MKKTLIIIILGLLTLTAFSQNTTDTDFNSTQEEAVLTEFYTILGPLTSPEKNPRVDETELRGRFIEIFESERIWKEFVYDVEDEYVFFCADETNWYDPEIGYVGDYHVIAWNEVMIDSTMERYYDLMIKDFEYDEFTYETIEHADGTFQEFYEFHKDGLKIRSYLVAWGKTEITAIIDFGFEGRK